MKRNSKNKIQLMDLGQLKKRFDYLKSKRKLHEGDSNMMKYIRYHLQKSYDETI